MKPDPSPIESLLKLAGERDQPSAEAMARAREAAHRSWQRGLDEPASGEHHARRRSAAPWAFAIAAGLAAVAVALWLGRPDLRPREVARVASLHGEARLDSSSAITMGAALHEGEVLATGSGRVALALGDALSLRVDHETRIRFDAPGQVTLLEGAVYVDSGGLNSRTVLRIHTPAGDVRHVGTQFQVRVNGAQTRVRVREGRVVLQREGGSSLDLGAGDAAEVTGSRVRVERDQPGHGDAWEWAAHTAPAFDIENRPLSEFLTWLAREHGWQLAFADAATQARAHDIRLHGSLTRLDAPAMLERLSLITGVPLSVDDGLLRVGTPP